MATKKRSKVTAEPVLKSWDDVKSKFKELAWLDVQVEKISAEQNEAIDKLKAKFEEKAEPLIARKIRLEKDVQEYAEFHAEQFEKGKTRDFGFGKIGFRRSSKLSTLSKWTWAKVLAKLKELGRKEFIRIKEEVNKDAIKSSGLDTAVLNSFGCQIKEENKFWYEIDRQAVSQDAAKLELHRKSA